MMNFKVQTCDLSSFAVLLWAAYQIHKCFLWDMSNPSVDAFDNLSTDGWEIRVILKYFRSTENYVSSFYIYGGAHSLNL